MSNLRIITDNKERPLLSKSELPAKAQEDFYYVKDDFDTRFVKYKGQFYDTQDVQGILVEDGGPRTFNWAMWVSPDSPLAKWQGVASDSYFSGMLFRYAGEGVVVGRYFS